MPEFGKWRQGYPGLCQTLSKQTAQNPEGQKQAVIAGSVHFWEFLCTKAYSVGSPIEEEMNNAFALFLPDTLQHVILKIITNIVVK